MQFQYKIIIYIGIRTPNNHLYYITLLVYFFYKIRNKYKRGNIGMAFILVKLEIIE